MGNPSEKNIMSPTILTFLILLLSHRALSISTENESIVYFSNVSEEDVLIKWYADPSATPEIFDTIASGDGFTIASAIGHNFVYTVRGVEHIFTVEDEKSAVIIGPEHFRVKCYTTEGTIRVNIIPGWSPFGAARFLHLVRIGYFKGCALNRVVKNFLTQFGISSDYVTRTNWRMESISDDVPIYDVPFQPGYLSYAGSGPLSRSTEIFIVMPGTSEQQLKHFGTNVWEIPFGYILPGDLHVLDKFSSYGDIVPFGNGPDPQKIYLEDGYSYLKQEFPAMTYIKNCEIVSPSSESRTSQDEF